MKANNYIYLSIVLMAASCGTKEAQYDASGVFEATEVVISAKTQGEILAIAVDEGDAVAQGDTIAVIDTRQLALQRQQLQSNRNATQQRQLDEQKQIASLRQQIANAKREQVRFTELLKAKAATQKQVDDIAYQISTLEAQLQALTDQLQSQNRSIAEQSEGLDSQIGAVDVQLGDATICSPLAGTVLQRYQEPGEYAMPGKPIVKIADIREMTLRAYITADQYNGIKIGQSVKVYVDGADEAYPGTVQWIASKAEFTPKTIQTPDERANLVYAVKIAVKNDGKIKIGMYGDVAFE